MLAVDIVIDALVCTVCTCARSSIVFRLAMWSSSKFNFGSKCFSWITRPSRGKTAIDSTLINSLLLYCEPSMESEQLWNSIRKLPERLLLVKPHVESTLTDLVVYW